MAVVTVNLKAASRTIAQSLRDVLKARGYVVAHGGDRERHETVDACELGPSAFEALITEVGNNAAMCLVAIDLNPDDE